MKHKNLPLIIAAALPIAFLAILAVVLVVPSLSIRPEHDFVYVRWDKQRASAYDGTLYKNYYAVENGRISLKPYQVSDRPEDFGPRQAYVEDAPKLYLYDVEQQTTREISFAEASALALDPGPSSPDGYTIVPNRGNDGIFELFGSSGGSDYSIAKGRGAKSLTGIVSSGNYYTDSFTLIGWVK